MGIVCTVLMVMFFMSVFTVCTVQQFLTLGERDCLQGRECVGNLIGETFHAAAVEQEQIGPFQHLQIVHGQRVVMQAARLSRSHVGYAYRIHAFGNVCGQQPDGIKRRDDGYSGVSLIAGGGICFLCGAAGEHKQETENQ